MRATGVGGYEQVTAIGAERESCRRVRPNGAVPAWNRRHESCALVAGENTDRAPCVISAERVQEASVGAESGPAGAERIDADAASQVRLPCRETTPTARSGSKGALKRGQRQRRACQGKGGKSDPEEGEPPRHAHESTPNLLA